MDLGNMRASILSRQGLLSVLYSILTFANMSTTCTGQSSEQVNFRSLSSCHCPQQVVVYECTVVGGTFTVWEGNAFMCQGEEISLIHFNFLNSVGECNNGAIIGRGVNVTNNHYTSHLNVTLTPDIFGKNITCSVDDSGATLIGTAQLIISDSFPPPRIIIPDRLGPSIITFSWSEVQHDGCSDFIYIIAGDNCGTCSPLMTTSNTSSCTNFESILLSPTNKHCNFTVQSVICGNVTGNISYSSILLKVPDAPIVKSVPVYEDQRQLLLRLETSFQVVDTFNISIDPLITGSAINYTVLYTDPDSGNMCGSSTVPPSYCENGTCNNNFELSTSLCLPSTNITVTVFASNALGRGKSSIPLFRGGTNNYVNVDFNPTTRTIKCHFLTKSLNSRDGNKIICIANISYGENCDQSAQGSTGEGIGNIVETPPLEFIEGVSKFCLNVTAINGNETLIVEMIELLDIVRGSENNVAAGTATVIIFAMIITVMTMLMLLFYYYYHIIVRRKRRIQDYYKERKEYVQEERKKESNPYPHTFTISHTLDEFISKYKELANSESRKHEVITLAGRILAVRNVGQNKFFYDVRGDGVQVQIMADTGHYSGENFKTVHDKIRKGDIIGVTGFPERTTKGVLGIVSMNTKVLVRCLHQLPEVDKLKDQAIRYRERHLDLMINTEVYEKFVTRAKIIKFLRTFLDNKAFLEVETPVMDYSVTSAATRPFKTHIHKHKQDLYLRLAPDLHLKKLVIGGLNRVYEIGRQFYNEGIDSSHSPEYTTCKFCMAYYDYEHLMNMTEIILSELVEEINKKKIISYRKEGKDVVLDFSIPFARIKIIPTLEKELKVEFPPSSEFRSDKFKNFLDDLCKAKGVECKEPRTTHRLLLKLITKFIEKNCINPTFLIDYPQIISPVAKWHRGDKELSERFELFVCQKEICNGYTELDDPELQKEFFQQQAQAKKAEDKDAHRIDEEYCQALEYGLPPTVGWTMGIDRLTMFLTNSSNIKEVQLFPILKPKTQHIKSKAKSKSARDVPDLPVVQPEVIVVDVAPDVDAVEHESTL